MNDLTENEKSLTNDVPEQDSDRTPPKDLYVCSKCSAELTEGQEFCAKCGTQKKQGTNNLCGKCGAQLHAEQKFCPQCGQEAGKIGGGNAPKRKRPLIFVGIGVVVVIAIIVLAISLGGRAPDFNEMYADISFEDWCEIAEDGSWMVLDTNPNNVDSDDFVLYYSDFIAAHAKIEEVNTDLGFPSAVFKNMGSTTSLQGRQFEENEKYKVSWTYHPDKGLEVMYEIK